MSDELKSERIVVLMTPSEVKALDDWSFSQRIRSRAEAIRRLVQLGLGASRAGNESPKSLSGKSGETSGLP